MPRAWQFTPAFVLCSMEGVPLDVECLIEMDATYQQGTNKTVGALPLD